MDPYYKHLQQLEITNLYIKKLYINRSIYINKILHICKYFELSNETLYLSIELFDKYITLNTKNQYDLNVVLRVCTIISSKYHDKYYITLSCLVNKNKHIDIQILNKCELDVLKYFNFNLSIPTIYTFCSFFLNALNLTIYENTLHNILFKFTLLNVIDDLYSHIAMYIIYLTILKYENISFDYFKILLSEKHINNIIIPSQFDKYLLIIN